MEPEALILAQIMNLLMPKMYINRQLIFTPWNYTGRKPPTFAEIVCTKLISEKLKTNELGRGYIRFEFHKYWCTVDASCKHWKSSARRSGRRAVACGQHVRHDIRGDRPVDRLRERLYAWTVELRPKQPAGLDGFDPSSLTSK